jgi:hypothetical protein
MRRRWRLDRDGWRELPRYLGALLTGPMDLGEQECQSSHGSYRTSSAPGWYPSTAGQANHFRDPFAGAAAEWPMF